MRLIVGEHRVQRRRHVGVRENPAVAGVEVAFRRQPLGQQDVAHQLKGIVRIVLRDGKLYGTVEKSLAEKPPHRVCDDCTSDRKGQPIRGMEIIRGLSGDGDQWDGGPKLAVRGFLGISLLGRTRVWERAE